MKTTSRYSLLIAILISGRLLSAQAITGDLSVTVVDPNGASISGAQLSLVSLQEGTAVSAQSNSTGTFTFSQMRPGAYSLKVTAPGFQEQLVKDLTIQLAQRTSINVRMTIGQLTQTVEVSGSAETLLNTETATAGQVLTEHTIEDLPLNGRNFIQLAQLTAGAVPIGTGNSPASTRTGRTDQTLSIEGLRESDVSYLVNGIETRNARFGNAGIRPDPDAIQEFNVQRGFFTPDYGGSAAQSSIRRFAPAQTAFTWRPSTWFAIEISTPITTSLTWRARDVRHSPRISLAPPPPVRFGYPSCTTAGTNCFSCLTMRDSASARVWTLPASTHRPRNWQGT